MLLPECPLDGLLVRIVAAELLEPEHGAVLVEPVRVQHAVVLRVQSGHCRRFSCNKIFAMSECVHLKICGDNIQKVFKNPSKTKWINSVLWVYSLYEEYLEYC